ncbi:MAG: hypothetical protein H6Q05_845 [Acidobacteria bacterium]|nr:hypothetical protein [Acidobacteriota bacterium]
MNSLEWNKRLMKRFWIGRVGPVLLTTLMLCALPYVLVGAGGQRGGGAQMSMQEAAPEPLHFQYMGPPSAGRIASVAGVPGDTTTYYAGAASGGIWKSTDSAKTFVPVFDDQPVQAIGALAVAPSDPRTVWAGTGEAWAIRDADVTGDGIYKSTDAGTTWRNAGLGETGRIGRILVHPTNANIVFACALGRTTGPQEERGVYRTTDGGATWQRVLFVNSDTGCSGIAMDPNNPNVLLAGTWQVVMHTWAMFSGGPGSGVYITQDGGTNWRKIEHPGLPKSPLGKIDVAIAPSNPRRMFALIQTNAQGSLWRSDDAGVSWKVVSWDRTLIGRAGYYIRITVNPANADEVLVANSSFHRSTDGGLTFPLTGGGCGDCHDIWMDPKNPDHWAATGDGGMGITTNHGQSFTSVSLPIGQMYHVAIDEQVPYWIYSNRQDDGTMRGPSNSPVPVTNVPTPAYAPPPAAAAFGRGGGRGGGEGGGGRGGAASTWQSGIGGCESGFTIPVPSDPNIIWATCYGGQVTRFDNRLRTARSVSPWIHTLDSEPDKLKYRAHWTPPLAIDPFDHNVVYYGAQVILKTSNGGQSWTVISPDLSTRDPSRVVSSGGVIGDNLGQFYGEVVFAIAPSEIQRGLIWAGTNDGKIWNTRDGGKTWNDLTGNVTGLPVWGTMRQIFPSRFDAGAAYVAVDFHLMDDRLPYIYKTTDFGQTWRKITGDLPAKHPLDYVLTVAENPNRKGMLFAGTGHAFYYSMDDGAHWTQFKQGLPAAPVTWIVPARLAHDVVVSTYGRGLFLLRDITTLEQSDQVPGDAPVYLYAPRAGVRQARSGRAEFLYSLKAAPGGQIPVQILDASGAVIRTMQVTGRPGLNRMSWDLRYEPPAQVALRTTPPDNPFIWDEPRFKGRETRPIVHWGIQGPQRAAPMAAPGKFTMRMTVNGTVYSRPFDVVKDPAIPSTDADLQANSAMQVRIVNDINSTVEMINRLEVIRKQVEDLLKENKGKGDLEKPLTDLDRKAMDVELQMLSRTDLHSDDKWYVEAYKIYMNLLWQYGEFAFGAGDVAGGAEYRPTDASVEILAMLEKELATAKTGFARVVETDLPAFNKAMAGKLPAIKDR